MPGSQSASAALTNQGYLSYTPTSSFETPTSTISSRRGSRMRARLDAAVFAAYGWIRKDGSNHAEPRSEGCYSACSAFEVVSGRNHSETWAGCIVSLTTPTRSPLSASRSVSSRSWAEKASRVFLASYFLL